MRPILPALALALLSTSAAVAQTAASDAVYTGAITTRWGKAVTPENAWRSYPRPQLQRDKWLNLNGLWDYAIAKAGTPQPQAMQGKILVPFPVESRLSGVARKVLPEDRVWYRRQFTVPAGWAGQNVKLNFGAVDYEAVVWVNGAVVGAHKGGSDSFGFDITAALKPGANEIVVQVAGRHLVHRVERHLADGMARAGIEAPHRRCARDAEYRYRQDRGRCCAKRVGQRH
jgi:hypothetical protein